jgi:serpin B
MQQIKQLFAKKGQEEDHVKIGSVVQGNTRFALELYQKLQVTEGNLFFSPYSISSTLAITYAGAREDTEAQMAKALHFLLDQKQIHPAFGLLGAKLEQVGKQGHVQLKVANALWPRKGYAILKEYLTLTDKFYGAQVIPIDFGDEDAARHRINHWVEEKTGSRIKDLIPPGILDSLTRLVLVNAIYFKGEWATQFDPSLTSDAAFLTAPDKPVQASMMNRKAQFRYAEGEGLQILELPYNGDNLSMIVALPRAPDGMVKLEDSLAVENLENWVKDLVEMEVEVPLPIFEITFPFRLDDTLKFMGMVNAFSERADFSGINSSKELFIGAVIHKAFITVNEQGTEAAAATALTMRTKALAFPAVVFRADHPFVFLIRENSTGSILFIGRVANPTS